MGDPKSPGERPLAFLESHLPQQGGVEIAAPLSSRLTGVVVGSQLPSRGVRPGGRFTLRKLVGKGWGPR